MVVCLRVSPELHFDEYNIPQRSIADIMGGSLTFVGGMQELNAFVCAKNGLVDGQHWPVGCFFEEESVVGDVFIIAVDERGEEIDLDVPRAKRILLDRFAHRPTAS